METLQSANFEEKVRQADGLVVVDFWAEWCGPCKMMNPVIEKAAEDHKSVKFYKVNTDQCSDVAGQFRIMSIPCLVLLKDGQEIDRKIGFQTNEKLNDWISEHAQTESVAD